MRTRAPRWLLSICSSPTSRSCAALSLQVQQQAGLRRDGQDIHSKLPLPLWDAILGGPATVQTIRGQATIHIPPGKGGARPPCSFLPTIGAGL